jgi:hypothetical protein
MIRDASTAGDDDRANPIGHGDDSRGDIVNVLVNVVPGGHMLIHKRPEPSTEPTTPGIRLR